MGLREMPRMIGRRPILIDQLHGDGSKETFEFACDVDVINKNMALPTVLDS